MKHDRDEWIVPPIDWANERNPIQEGTFSSQMRRNGPPHAILIKRNESGLTLYVDGILTAKDDGISRRFQWGLTGRRISADEYARLFKRRTGGDEFSDASTAQPPSF